MFFIAIWWCMVQLRLFGLVSFNYNRSGLWTEGSSVRIVQWVLQISTCCVSSSCYCCISLHSICWFMLRFPLTLPLLKPLYLWSDVVLWPYSTLLLPADNVLSIQSIHIDYSNCTTISWFYLIFIKTYFSPCSGGDILYLLWVCYFLK